MSATRQENKKAQERELLDRARLIYQTFPVGEPVDGEGTNGQGADFVFPAHRLAVEVTQLFREPIDSVAPHELESFQEDVVRRAHQMHSDRGEPAVHVTVYFSDEAIRGVDSVALSLADYVREHSPDRDESDQASLPPGFTLSASVAESVGLMAAMRVRQCG